MITEIEKEVILFMIIKDSINILTAFCRDKPGHELIQFGYDVTNTNGEWEFIVWKKLPSDKGATDVYSKKYQGKNVSELLEAVMSEALGILFYNSNK